MVIAVIFVLLVAVVAFVGRPLLLRASGLQAAPDGGAITSFSDRLELEAARDAKLREIRDAELDHETGKLSDEDYEAVDSTLRTQAIGILNELDRLP